MTAPQVHLHRAQHHNETGEGICRTCAKPIWLERGTIERRDRGVGWSDRHTSDSLVCFKAVSYRHVPLTGREAALWDAAVEWSIGHLRQAAGR